MTSVPGAAPPTAAGPDDLLPVEEYLAGVLAAIHLLEPARLTLEDAEGGVLAEDAVALSSLPSFDNSAMDGYAVRSADVAGATSDSPVTLRVIGEAPAGDTHERTLADEGECLRIMTGAPLPAGADAVVPVEWTDGGGYRVQIFRPAPAGHAIRRRGDDVAEGQTVLTEGIRLGPAQIGLLAASGHAAPLVRRRPIVSVIATGSELTEPGVPLSHGRIWDSNSYLLAAAARQAGAVAVRQCVADDPREVLAVIAEQRRMADLLVTSGGVSMGGEHDVVKAALAEQGEVAFTKVAMQPGMPQGFGVLAPDRTPVFTLPGNPVSAFVSFHLFVRPALAALQGLPAGLPPAAPATLTGPVRSPEGKRSFLRGVLDPGAATVTPLTGQGSHQLGALGQANALIVVPEQVTSLAAGQTAGVMPLP
jgi:molybdopterin molybdotransferase